MRKTLSILLTLLLLVQLLPLAALPARAEAPEDTRATFNTVQDAVKEVRKQMVARNTEISFQAGFALSQQVISDIYYSALEHTGVANEGDYIAHQMSGASMGGYGNTITYSVKYFTTASQETEVTNKINSILKSLNLNGKTDEQKVRAIHDYITKNVHYDFDALSHPDDNLPHTTYAALFRGKAVCQGYATLFYRLALEVGIDCRYIPGIGSNSTGSGPHGWNIVKVGTWYYNMDVTWDENTNSYDYYLRGTKNFAGHARDAEFNTADFNNKYPMSPEDYSVNNGNGGPLTPGSSTPTVGGFTDVFENTYYADAVEWAVDGGITNGTSATTFSPNGTCTRAQVVTFLWRAVGSPAPSSSYCKFTDVKLNTYYYNPVLWAVEKEITAGTSSTTFSPESGCTRGQVVTFLWRAKGKPAVSDSGITTVDENELPVIPVNGNPADTGFLDVAPTAYYAEAVRWAVANGITNGTSAKTFSPNSTCTRGQIVTFLYRAYK